MAGKKKSQGRTPLGGAVRNLRVRVMSEAEYNLIVHTLSPELRGQILLERAQSVQSAAFERIVKAVGRVK